MKPCLGCGSLTTNSYCPRCDPVPKRYREKRGSGWAQTRFRAAVLKRAGSRCERCGSTVGVEAHHRVPVTLGGTHDLRNGEALCTDCHRRPGV